jgi:hypothetical protein
MRSKDSLTTLCGLSGNETELDFSKQNLGAGDAVLIANDICDNRALVKLLMASNNIRAEGGKALAEALKETQVMKELDVAGNYLSCRASNGTGDMSGVIAIANTIPTMGALLSLNLSSNDIGAYYDDQQDKMIATPEGTLFPTHIHAIVLLTV